MEEAAIPETARKAFELTWALRWQREPIRELSSASDAALLGRTALVGRFIKLKKLLPSQVYAGIPTRSPISSAILGRDKNSLQLFLEYGEKPTHSDLETAVSIGSQTIFDMLSSEISVPPDFDELRDKYLKEYDARIRDNAKRLFIPDSQVDSLKWPQLLDTERIQIEHEIATLLNEDSVMESLNLPSPVDPSQSTFVNAFSVYNSEVLLNQVLDLGADIDGTEPYGQQCPIYTAAANCSWDVIELLLKRQPDLSLCGTDAIRTAANIGDIALVEALIQQGANPNPRIRHPNCSKREKYWKGIARETQGYFKDEIIDILKASSK